MRTITFIGSSRFNREHNRCATLLASLGAVVLTHGYLFDEPTDNPGRRRPVFDLAMLDKIHRSDAVLVIDVEEANDQVEADKGYVGVETARELLWATMNQVPVAFLSDLMAGVLKTGGLPMAMQDLVDALTDGEVLAMALDPAVDLLEHVTGQARAADAQEDTKLTVMHAVLSQLADENAEDAPLMAETPTMARQTLRFLNLEPLPFKVRLDYLRMVDSNSSLDREVIGV